MKEKRKKIKSEREKEKIRRKMKEKRKKGKKKKRVHGLSSCTHPCNASRSKQYALDHSRGR